MSTFINKIKIIKDVLEIAKGNFDFFALIELREVENQWDIVFSAEWLPKRESKASDILIDIIYSLLDEDELFFISRIIPLDIHEPFISKILKLAIAKDNKELNNIEVNGIVMKNVNILSDKNWFGFELKKLSKSLNVEHDDSKKILKTYTKIKANKYSDIHKENRIINSKSDSKIIPFSKLQERRKYRNVG